MVKTGARYGRRPEPRNPVDIDPLEVAARSARGSAADAARSARSSLARTRRSVRHWCVHNHAYRMGTLTYRPEDLPADVDELWSSVRLFRLRLQRAGIAQPLLVPEPGSKSGRLHVHGAFPDYVRQAQLQEVWGQGFVSMNRKTARGGSERERCRAAAGYLAGYVSKLGNGSAASLVGFNRRRYSVPRGTQPPAPVKLSATSMYDLIAEAQKVCGHTLNFSWSSSSADDWDGPETAIFVG